MWVSPFRDLRVNGYLLLTAAYRSLSRLSSALSAKASTLRSSSLDRVAKMGFLRTIQIRSVLAVSHSSFSFLRVDNGSYIALYSIICFFEIEFILIN